MGTDNIVTQQSTSLPKWAFAYGEPACHAHMRSAPEDFCVSEQLSFNPDNEGQHVLVQIRKRGCNTLWVAEKLAAHADVAPKQVSYAGLKDRQAVAIQWFSVDLAGKVEPDWSQLDSAELTVLQSARHRRKLRRGALTSNDFVIVLRELHGSCEYLEKRLQCIQTRGVPNYFGPQRFGHNGQNIVMARAVFQGKRVRRHQRGLYLSAARSLLFNQVLSERVAARNWEQALPGEALVLAGSHSFFIAAENDSTIEQRLKTTDIHPSGPLYGKGPALVVAQAAQLEARVLADSQDLCIGLAAAGLEQDRRPLRLLPQDLQWELRQDQLLLRFSLPAGAYATAVIRELCHTNELTD